MRDVLFNTIRTRTVIAHSLIKGHRQSNDSSVQPAVSTKFHVENRKEVRTYDVNNQNSFTLSFNRLIITFQVPLL